MPSDLNPLPDLHLSSFERFGILPHVERVLVSDEVGAAKPEPQAFAPILAAHAPERILFVDDQVKNTGAAEQLGMRTVLALDATQVGRDVEAQLLGAHLDLWLEETTEGAAR